MSAVPAIYDDLSPEARDAYARWMLALVGRAEHVDGCSCCNERHYCCADGIAANEAEQRAWKLFNAIRTREAA